MINDDWAAIAKALKALPGEQRMFSTKYFQGRTSDTRKPCGCALGQLALHIAGSYDKGPFLGNRLGITELRSTDVYAVNDGFRPDDDTEVACVARYAHVLSEAERLASGAT